MNGFIARLVALSVLWALCDLLLPDGKSREGVRFVMGLMVMLSLLTGIFGAFVKEDAAPAAVSLLQQNHAEQNREKQVLQSRANQIRQLLLQLAKRAGYEAEAVVVLTLQGQLERIDLSLWKKEGITPLMSGGELKERILLLLGIAAEQVNLATND